jgi:anti-sigma B factor antagonist
MDAPFEASARRQGDSQVLAPCGRIDQASAAAFGRLLEPHLAACTADAPPLILDFAGVPYISSVGLRVLMLAARQVAAQRGRLGIAALDPVVEEVFQISRFNLVLKVFPTVEAAAAALA